MDIEKKQKILKFFEEYGQDYIGDGSKERILKMIKSGSDKELLSILQPLTDEWKTRTEDLGYFRIITDYRNRMSMKEINHKEISYMDSNEEQKIPTYRDVKYREKDLNRSPFGL